MITLEVYQGSAFARVVQAHDRDGKPPNYFLPSDVVSGAVWDGQTQSVLFTPSVKWHTGLASIDVLTGGSGYSANPLITVSGGGASANATATATVIGGSIVEITLTSFGDEYSAVPTITIADTTGTGATAVGVPAYGWKDGTVLIRMTAAQTANLDTMGQYRFRSTATRTEPTALIDCLIRVYPSPGLSTKTTLTYCTYQDLLDVAPWIAGVQDVDTDQEGFYSQRLKARLWLDNIVSKHFQGGHTGSYGAHSNDFGNSGGKSIGADTVIRDYLKDNKLLRTPDVIQVCAHHSVGLIGIAQLGSGGGMSLAHRGAWHLQMAERHVFTIVAEIDTDGDGNGDLAANLSTLGVTYG